VPGSSAERARKLVRERIGVVRAAMSTCDDEIERELAVLAARGIVPTCSKGCAHCCRQEILVPRAEAEVIIEWLQASWSAEQIEALKDRLRTWLAWHLGELTRRVNAGEDRLKVTYEDGPGCVVLSDDACSIYPVRPTMCRMHYVTSSADRCRSERDPAFARGEDLAVLSSIPRVALPSVHRIREEINRQGTDYWGTVHLLPEWLAHLLRVADQPWRTAPPLRLFDRSR
jgi:Fe-S-cluster containining protein